MALILLATVPTSMAASQEDIQKSVDEGVAWLVSQQTNDPNQWDDGAWLDNTGYYSDVATTSLAVLKLTDYSREHGYKPLDPANPYYQNIKKGIDFILNQKNNNIEYNGNHLLTQDITGSPDDKNGNGKAILFQARYGYEETYNTGMALMALGNLQDDAYKDDVQDIVDFFIHNQNNDGGWRYNEGEKISDQSNTGFAVLGLAYADKAGADLGDIRTGLKKWVSVIQADNGGSRYMETWDWINIYKTGSLLLEMRVDGDPTTDVNVQKAIDYTTNTWSQNNNDPGWRHNFLASYSIMKGLEAYQIDKLGSTDWFDDLSTDIIQYQNSDGSWSADSYWLASSIISTEFALLTLEKSTPIKPPEPSTSVPEFPTVAIPVAAILGLIFVFGRRKE